MSIRNDLAVYGIFGFLCCIDGEKPTANEEEMHLAFSPSLCLTIMLKADLHCTLVRVKFPKYMFTGEWNCREHICRAEWADKRGMCDQAGPISGF